MIRINIILILIFTFFMMTFASAADVLTIDELKEKFPNGMYWNHPFGTPSNQNGWTNTPCSPHSDHNHRVFDGACGCNCFNGLTIQCEGFAFQLQEDAFGEGYGVSSHSHSRIVRDYQSAMNNLKAGDVIRFKQTDKIKHSVFVISVNGDNITYADCNANGDCEIRWDVPGTKSMFESTFLYLDPGESDLATKVETSDKSALEELSHDTIIDINPCISVSVNSENPNHLIFNYPNFSIDLNCSNLMEMQISVLTNGTNLYTANLKQTYDSAEEENNKIASTNDS